jgi:hypothetical protein
VNTVAARAITVGRITVMISALFALLPLIP